MKQQDDSLESMSGKLYGTQDEDKLMREMVQIGGKMPSISSKQSVMNHLQAAAAQLQAAYQVALERNQMVASVPVFQQMLAVQKQVTAMLLEVNKVRGLE